MLLIYNNILTSRYVSRGKFSFLKNHYTGEAENMNSTFNQLFQLTRLSFCPSVLCFHFYLKETRSNSCSHVTKCQKENFLGMSYGMKTMYFGTTSVHEAKQNRAKYLPKYNKTTSVFRF